jgi:hypothetical protein
VLLMMKGSEGSPMPMRSQNSGERNLGKEPLEMLLIEIKGERPTSN